MRKKERKQGGREKKEGEGTNKDDQITHAF